MTKHSAYRELETRFSHIGKLRAALGILEWDMQTTMPEGSASTRAEQLATMKTLIHHFETAPELEVLFQGAESESLQFDERANLHEMKRLWIHAKAVPSELVEALSKATSTCHMIWREARRDNEFARLKPALEQVVTLVREVASIKAQALQVSPYDALMDEYEPGAKSVEIDRLFAGLAAFLPGFIDEVLSHQAKQPNLLPLQGPFPIEKQRALGLRIMAALGFDFNRGRLDVSHHPFCGGAVEDVRITTRYNEESFLSSLMGIVHETGHALYEQGLPTKWRYQPAGRARGMALHESQSLLIEMQLCRSRSLLHWLTPMIRDAFSVEGAAWQAENLYRHCIRVERGLIRVESDEVTYPAHVIFRYHLEKALIDGTLEVGDLPTAWAESMKRYVGIAPPDDKQGCMQDIHWMEGIFGYFPTYTLGAITAAQLFDAAMKKFPSLPTEIEQGTFSQLVDWLREQVHAKASFYATEQILSDATGMGMDVEIYKRVLRQKYLG